jgi:hypothetical protein
MRGNKMEPYIVFNIKGLCEHTVLGEAIFIPESDSEISKVEILCNDKDITGIKLFYKIDQSIDRNKAENKIRQFIASIICNLQVVVKDFDISIDSIFNPNMISDNNNLSTTIELEDMYISSSIIVTMNASHFKKLYEANVKEEIKEDMNLFLNIQKIDDLYIRYLVLYELLFRLVPKDSIKNKKTQKDVCNYVRNVYNKETFNEKLEFRKTTKLDCNYQEDILTHYRNIIAHNNCKIDKSFADNSNIIVQYCRLINKVIYFLLTN